MPKMENASLTMKISLAQIMDTGNIREAGKYGPNKKGEYPEEIRELAQSIKTIGQLQPVVVKLAGEKDGVKQYELIAGFRRRAAFQYLFNSGEDYSMIDTKIATGDKLTIQLVENIQREDLTAPEREAAIFQLAENRMKQNEIASQLSKNKAFVSINISAHKMRQKAAAANIDLTGVETSTLAEFLSVPEENLLSLLEKLVVMGKTRAAASALAEPFKKKKDNPPPAAAPSPAPTVSAGSDPVVDIDPIIDDPPEVKKPGEKPKPGAQKKPVEKEPPIEADHRVVDVNIVLTVVYEYIENMKKQIAENMGKKDTGGIMDRLEAAKDILALIHERLDNA